MRLVDAPSHEAVLDRLLEQYETGGDSSPLHVLRAGKGLVSVEESKKLNLVAPLFLRVKNEWYGVLAGEWGSRESGFVKITLAGGTRDLEELVREEVARRVPLSLLDSQSTPPLEKLKHSFTYYLEGSGNVSLYSVGGVFFGRDPQTREPYTFFPLFGWLRERYHSLVESAVFSSGRGLRLPVGGTSSLGGGGVEYSFASLNEDLGPLMRALPPADADALLHGMSFIKKTAKLSILDYETLVEFGLVKGGWGAWC